MKVACIIDVKKKVQEFKVNILRKIIPEIKFDIFVANKTKAPNLIKYQIVYYLSYNLFLRMPVKHPIIIGSVTSHKSLDNLKRTIKTLKKFKKVSVNNKILFNVFSKYIKIEYIPNGVDTSLFYPSNNQVSYNPANITIGWAGNTNRATKNFRSIVLPLKKKKFSNIKIITMETKKSHPYKQKHHKMINFYHKLNFYLVSSSTEGTPNPALEAAACGVPLVSTKVGNMIDLIKDGISGFFVEKPKIKYFLSVFDKINRLSESQYIDMSNSILGSIESGWKWSDRANSYASFLKCQS